MTYGGAAVLLRGTFMSSQIVFVKHQLGSGSVGIQSYRLINRGDIR